MMVKNLSLPTWVQNIRLLAHLILSCYFLFSSALCLIRLLLSQAQLVHVYVRSWLGVYRDNDAKQPHVGLSPYKSGEDAYTWSQRRWRVRIDGRKSRTCAWSVCRWCRYPQIGPIAPKFDIPIVCSLLAKVQSRDFAQIFFTIYTTSRSSTARNPHSTLITTYRDKHDNTV